MPLFAPELFAPFVSKKTSRIENRAGWWYERYGSPVQHLFAGSGNRETTGWSRNRMSQMVCAVGEHYIDMGAALASNDAYKTGPEVDAFLELLVLFFQPYARIANSELMKDRAAKTLSTIAN